MDPRVFAELYATVWLWSERVRRGSDTTELLRQLGQGRRLHRRRYAAKRIVTTVGGRLEQLRKRGPLGGPSCLIPRAASGDPTPARPGDDLGARLVTVLALVWQVPAEWVVRELGREEQRIVAADPTALDPPASRAWARSRKPPRVRVDQRGGRGARMRGRPRRA